MGPQSFASTYSGDANDPGGITNAVIPQVLALPSISLVSATTTVGLGQPVTVTATVQGAIGVPVPTGTIYFYYSNGGPPVTNTIAIDASGRASYTFLPTSIAPYSVGAEYSGDGAYQATQTTATIDVLSSPSLALTSSTNLAAPGQPVTLTAAVTPTPGVAAPGGTVSVLDGATPLGSAPLDANGRRDPDDGGPGTRPT